MLRSSVVLLLLASGCAAEEAEKTWGELACEGKPGGHLATLTTCGGEWRTWHKEGQAASAGRIGPKGELLPAYAMWWPDGTVAGRLEGGVMKAFDESGDEHGSAAWGSQGPEACPGGTVKDETLESGHRKVWCADADGKEHGRMTTLRADGSVEGVQFWVHGKRHGPFEAFHPNGRVWIRGDYATGKRHGPWHTWTGGGKVYQAAIEADWADHKAQDSWISISPKAGVPGA